MTKETNSNVNATGTTASTTTSPCMSLVCNTDGNKSMAVAVAGLSSLKDWADFVNKSAREISIETKVKPESVNFPARIISYSKNKPSEKKMGANGNPMRGCGGRGDDGGEAAQALQPSYNVKIEVGSLKNITNSYAVVSPTGDYMFIPISISNSDLTLKTWKLQHPRSRVTGKLIKWIVISKNSRRMIFTSSEKVPSLTPRDVVYVIGATASLAVAKNVTMTTVPVTNTAAAAGIRIPDAAMARNKAQGSVIVIGKHTSPTTTASIPDIAGYTSGGSSYNVATRGGGGGNGGGVLNLPTSPSKSLVVASNFASAGRGKAPPIAPDVLEAAKRSEAMSSCESQLEELNYRPSRCACQAFVDMYSWEAYRSMDPAKMSDEERIALEYEHPEIAAFDSDISDDYRVTVNMNCTAFVSAMGGGSEFIPGQQQYDLLRYAVGMKDLESAYAWSQNPLSQNEMLYVVSRPKEQNDEIAMARAEDTTGNMVTTRFHVDPITKVYGNSGSEEFDQAFVSFSPLGMSRHPCIRTAVIGETWKPGTLYASAEDRSKITAEDRTMISARMNAWDTVVTNAFGITGLRPWELLASQLMAHNDIIYVCRTNVKATEQMPNTLVNGGSPVEAATSKSPRHVTVTLDVEQILTDYPAFIRKIGTKIERKELMAELRKADIGEPSESDMANADSSVLRPVTCLNENRGKLAAALKAPGVAFYVTPTITLKNVRYVWAVRNDMKPDANNAIACFNIFTMGGMYDSKLGAPITDLTSNAAATSAMITGKTECAIGHMGDNVTAIGSSSNTAGSSSSGGGGGAVVNNNDEMNMGLDGVSDSALLAALDREQLSTPPTQTLSDISPGPARSVLMPAVPIATTESRKRGKAGAEEETRVGSRSSSRSSSPARKKH
jgi:hypothetical protein